MQFYILVSIELSMQFVRNAGQHMHLGGSVQILKTLSTADLLRLIGSFCLNDRYCASCYSCCQLRVRN